jgi:hypothetical protein
MEKSTVPLVIEAERLNGGVIIVFDDGKCAFYSATLLRTTFPQAVEVRSLETDK